MGEVSFGGFFYEMKIRAEDRMSIAIEEER